jgi:chromosome partitioning protein
MIINVAHTKGGVGKTAIATNLSIAFAAPILDLDIQQSSNRFFQIREEEGLNTLPVYNHLTNELINRYKSNPKHHLIIDSGGMDNDIIRNGLEVADLIITPVSLSQVEIFGLEDFNDLLNSSDIIQRTKTFVLLNNVNLRAKKEIVMARDLIEGEFDFKLLATMLGSRKAYKEAYSLGRNTVELSPSSPAGQEIISLTNELKKHIKKMR